MEYTLVCILSSYLSPTAYLIVFYASCVYARYNDESEGCTDYLKGPYKGGRTRLKFIRSLGYKVYASSLKSKL